MWFLRVRDQSLTPKQAKDLSDIAENSNAEARRKRAIDLNRKPAAEIMDWYTACYPELEPIPKEITFEFADRPPLVKFLFEQLVTISDVQELAESYRGSSYIFPIRLKDTMVGQICIIKLK